MKNNNNELPNEDIEEAVWQEKRSRISTVWIVPIVALVVGAWLMYQSFSERGPIIEITFKSAEGVVAGKTVIRYKDIEVGKVTEVSFAKDLKTVIVKAEMKKIMRPYLSSETNFFIMKARLSATEVEGLDTLLSGVYIVMNPYRGDKDSKTVKRFKGLSKIPVISSGDEGEVYRLKADTIGSIGVGSPIYYKKLKAGRVASYQLDQDGKNVTIKVFVNAPFNKLITDKTRFWNASGITASIGADGVQIRTESLTSIISGGLAFDNFETIARGAGKKVDKSHMFKLHPDYKSAQKVAYNRELYFWIDFNHSIRGLSVGAPVEFRGVKVGEVVHFSLVGNSDNAEFKIPILIKIEPGRFNFIGKSRASGSNVNVEVLKKLIDNGFRAQIKSGNLLTGELFVDLDMYKDLPKVSLIQEKGFYVIPTVPATMESLKSDVQTLLERLAAIPFEEIGKELHLTLKGIRSETLPLVDETIKSTGKMMKSVDNTMGAVDKNYLSPNAKINKRLIKLLDEMTRTSRSIKNLTDYLERHPESLIQGK